MSTPEGARLNILNHLFMLFMIAGMIGLARSGATGQGRMASPRPSASRVGLVVLIVAETSWLAALSVTEALYNAATLATMLGLILAGDAEVRAHRWIGWRRFTPLACGLFILLVLLPSFALPDLAVNYAIGLWGVCRLGLGVALWQEGHRATTARPSAPSQSALDQTSTWFESAIRGR